MKRFVLLLFFFFSSAELCSLFAQKDSTGFVYDSFFLAKKKGLFGRLGKSITADKPKPELVKTGTIKNNLPFNRYINLPIRNIHIVSLELNQKIDDTTKRRKNFIVNIGNKLHRKTREVNISNNLFFKEGDKINPYLLADNERHLREQAYLQDARISLSTTASKDSVDVYVYTKDVFSIGGSLNISGSNNFDGEIKDENFLGNATRVSFKVLYDQARGPATGYGGEILQRNIRHSYTNLAVGFKTFNTAFSSGKPEETYTYINFDRPLVSAYMPFTGNIDLSWHKTANAYVVDSVYKSQFNYEYVDFDGWGGYNFGCKKFLKDNISQRIRHFVAFRVFHHQFQQVPGWYQNSYNYVYANITGVLGAINIFKQNFYKTKYIYGFGRQEDVPEGYSLSLIGGWTNKQNRPRPYYGFDFTRNYFGKKGNYYNYTFRAGTSIYDYKFEDVDLLFNLEYFSRLKTLSRHWYIRHFINFGVTQQLRTLLDQPLFLSSNFGLPEISNGNVAAQTRITLKKEMAFYGNWSLLGCRFSPFIFSNGCFLIPTNESLAKSEFYSSLGAGLRARNEALIFGTIECRFNYFPRINLGMQQLRIDFKTDLRFKYNSQYIKRPDFVSPNG